MQLGPPQLPLPSLAEMLPWLVAPAVVAETVTVLIAIVTVTTVSAAVTSSIVQVVEVWLPRGR